MVIYNSTNEKYTLEAQSQRNLKTMVVPKLFAYVCDIPMNISMNIAIYREDENGKYLVMNFQVLIKYIRGRSQRTSPMWRGGRVHKKRT